MSPLTDFQARVTNVQEILQTASDAYTNEYSTRTANSGSAVVQNQNLQLQLNTLNAKLATAKSLSDTYDREFLDRSADKKIGGFFSSRGVNTFQDWLLLIFYTLYGLISFGICIIALYGSQSPLISVSMVISASLLMGVLITAMIVRFA